MEKGCHSCLNCVKLRRSNTQASCLALKELVGRNGNCWAYSNDPDFWKRYEKAVRQYAAVHGQ